MAASVKKQYRKPATPFERLLDHEAISEETKEALREQRGCLDPVALLHTIREAQSALAAITCTESRQRDVNRESLDQFLAQLPELWRLGAIRPTHSPRSRAARTWRTRNDPFEGFWPQGLEWLQKEPDATAKALFQRLDVQHPGRFHEGQLRTLQRRVRQWRMVMARQLICGNPVDARPWKIAVIGAETGVDTQASMSNSGEVVRRGRTLSYTSVSPASPVLSTPSHQP